MARVLIVDDDTALREGLAETLADLGHAPLEAADGEAALDLLGRAPGGVAAVLLDLRMPGRLDGLAVLLKMTRQLYPHRRDDRGSAGGCAGGAGR